MSVESKVIIDVIAKEHSLTGYSPYYYYAAKWEDKEWETNSSHYDLIRELATGIAKDIVGTNSDYRIDTFFLDELTNFKKRGIEGYSENPTGMIITRKLDREELRALSINLGIAIKECKRVLED
jgi:hypothetical protein